MHLRPGLTTDARCSCCMAFPNARINGSISSRRWAPPGFAASPSISAAIHPASARRKLTRTHPTSWSVTC